jgi:peptidoglycan L-alanyl-D-glutamate endopeptidase CwlK
MPSNLSERDTTRLEGCAPDLIAKVDQLFGAMALLNFPLFVVEGLRTAVRQNFHFNKGRTTLGPNPRPGRPFGDTVTECDGYTKKSNHQMHSDGLGHAVDVAFQPTGGLADPFSPKWPWDMLGEHAEALGLKWGGRFPKVDLDHVELP